MRWRAAACLGAFAAGVASGSLSPVAALAGLVLWVAAAAALRAPHEAVIRLLLAGCLVAGHLAARFAAPEPPGPEPAAELETPGAAEVWGTVDGFVDEVEGGSAALLRIEAVRAPGGPWLPARTGAVVTFPGGPAPAAGATLHLAARFKRVRNAGIAGEYDRAAREARRGVFYDARAEPYWRTVRAPGSFDAFLERVRVRALGAARRRLSADAYGVFAGLAFGEQRQMSQALRDAWRDAGVSHLVAISGLHLAIVFLVMRLGIRWLLARSERLLLAIDVPFWSGALALPAVGMYAAVSGMQAPTLRSFAMLGVAFLAQALGRRAGGLEALCWGVLGLLALAPAWLYHPGFQLSFAAVFGAIAWSQSAPAEPEAPRLTRARRYLVAAFVSSVVATVWTAPLAAYHFGRVSPAGLVANLPLIPYVSAVLTPAAFAYAVGAAAWPAFPWPWFVLDAGLGLANALVRFFAALPYAGLELRLDLVETGLVMAVVALAGLAAVTPHRRWRLRAAVAVALCLAAGAVHAQRRAAAYASPLRVDVLSVGQGDAVLVSSRGRHLLIDTGDARQYRRLLRPFLVAGRLHIETLVLTHPHEDHVGAAVALLAEFPPERVVVPSIAHFAAERPDILAAAARAGVPVEEWTAGETRPWAAAAIQVLHPAAPFRRSFPLAGGNWNELSLVLRVASGGRCALLPGDAEDEAERAAAASGMLTPCELLKAPHHGSRTSSTPAFLARVRPQLTFISAGYHNSFHHPHPSTLRRFENAGSAWHATAEEGTLSWSVDDK
jgi:competence protein ComEC